MFNQTSSFGAAEASPANSLILSLGVLSARLRLSRQTLIRWVDRHLVEATLGWSAGGDHVEERIIALSPKTLAYLDCFAEEYRDDLVSCVQARQILKMVDPKRVQRMIREDDLTAVSVDGKRQVVVGSIEDYLIRRETTPA